MQVNIDAEEELEVVGLRPGRRKVEFIVAVRDLQRAERAFDDGAVEALDEPLERLQKLLVEYDAVAPASEEAGEFPAALGETRQLPAEKGFAYAFCDSVA